MVVGAGRARDGSGPGGLPTDRAFVLQFRRHADVKKGCMDGRIEHITSGRAELFHTLEELVSFVGESLEGPSDSMPSDSLDQSK